MNHSHQKSRILDHRCHPGENAEVNPHPPLPELPGKLLLADPSLRDGIFQKSVILLAEHSADDGAFGLILNQPSGQKVGDLLPDEEFHDLANVAVHVGGPVSRGHLTFAAFWVRDSVFDYAVRISAEEAVAYVRQPDTLVRAFIGYSGWTGGQLEGEMDNSAWFQVESNAQLLTTAHDITLWKKLLASLSPFHRLLANAPDEVMAN